MKSKIKYIFPVLVLIIALTGYELLAGLATPPEEKPLKTELAKVKGASIRKESVQLTVNAHGVVQPSEAASLISEVGGRVIEISPKFKTGGVFAKDELMVAVDPVNYEAAAAEAAYSVAQARRLYKMEKLRAAQAKEDWKIVGKGAPTEIVLRKPQLVEALAQLKSAEAALKRAETQLNRAQIKAPYACIIIQKNISQGGYLSEGSAVADIAGLDNAEIRLQIPQNDAALIRLPRTGSKADAENPIVRIHTEYLGERHTFTGMIIRTEGIVDKDTRQVCLIAGVNDPYRLSINGPQLVFGSFVSAEITGRRINEAFVVPSHLIQEDDTLWIINKQNKLEIRKVTVLKREPERTVITGGITENDMLSLQRFDAWMEGKTVRVDSSSNSEKAATQRKDEDNA